MPTGGNFRALLALLLLASAPAGLAARSGEQCAVEPDRDRRLDCYDSIFRPDHGGGKAVPPSPEALPYSPPRIAPPPTDRAEAAAPPEDSLRFASVMTKLWELGPEDKRGTFILRTYLPNYFLPLHYTSSLNDTPQSPTRSIGDREADLRPLEAKLQVSLRAKIVQGLLLPDADLWFAYTQRSLWQAWSRDISSPFRSTDYQPEVIYVVPIPVDTGSLPGGWRWRMLRLGFAHQSNGRAKPFSRSWDRVYAAAGFDRGDFGLTITSNHRLRQSAEKGDNPDLTRYAGMMEVTGAWLPGLSTASVTWRINRHSLSRGALEFDWTFPVKRDNPRGLRWYAQIFTGYNETLLDYNHRQTSIGIGLSLFQL